MAASPKSNLALIMRHELRVMVADRTLPAIAALFTVLLLYGFFTGLHETRQRESVVKSLVAAETKTNADNKDRKSTRLNATLSYASRMPSCACNKKHHRQQHIPSQ